MLKLPASLARLIDHLAELPSIGPRQATRLAFYLITQERERLGGLADTLKEMENIRLCNRCYFIHEHEDGLCDICRDPNRDQRTILIIEKETDLVSLEKTGKYRGRYFILGAMPKTGIIENWQKLRVEKLKAFIQAAPPDGLGGQADEIIMGFNLSSIGDFHSSIIGRELGALAKKISRLGRGLPTGGEIEFADDETLGASLDRRS
jgi:recombination protein RecR